MFENIIKKRFFNIIWVLLSIVTLPLQIFLFGFGLWFNFFLDDIKDLKESFAGF